MPLEANLSAISQHMWAWLNFRHKSILMHEPNWRLRPFIEWNHTCSNFKAKKWSELKSSTLILLVWFWTEPMNTMGNAFVACGVIYCIDGYNSKSTTINFAYDTKTGKQWNPNIQFTNQYRVNSMVDYNPREKVLYAWDHKRLVTYSVTFE